MLVGGDAGLVLARVLGLGELGERADGGRGGGELEELREALRLFSKMGATGNAERIASLF